MASSAKWIVALGIGLAGGWALSRLADSPGDAGEKLRDFASIAKKRVGRWVALEGERLDDMLAEARSRVEPDIAPPPKTKRGRGRRAGIKV
jgi:hypothetical protein